VCVDLKEEEQNLREGVDRIVSGFRAAGFSMVKVYHEEFPELVYDRSRLPAHETHCFRVYFQNPPPRQEGPIGLEPGITTGYVGYTSTVPEVGGRVDWYCGDACRAPGWVTGFNQFVEFAITTPTSSASSADRILFPPLQTAGKVCVIYRATPGGIDGETCVSLAAGMARETVAETIVEGFKNAGFSRSHSGADTVEYPSHDLEAALAYIKK